MNRRSVFLTVISFCGGLAFLAALIVKTRINPLSLFAGSGALDRIAFMRFTLWAALSVYLSSLKWRLTDEVLRGPDKQPLSANLAFTSSAFGVALGQVFPAAVGMSAARTLTAAVHGKALRRGALGTIFEQSFDFLVVCTLAIPSLTVCGLHCGAATWFVIAVPISVCAPWAFEKTVDSIRSMRTQFREGTYLSRTVGVLQSMGVFDTRLRRKLVVLAFARFALVILAARETTMAIHASVPLTNLIIAMPLVLLAMLTGLTPGGLGIVEVTYAGILHFLGTPLSLATEWAIAARILTVTSAIVVAACGAVLSSLARLLEKGRTVQMENSVERHSPTFNC